MLYCCSTFFVSSLATFRFTRFISANTLTKCEFTRLQIKSCDYLRSESSFRSSSRVTSISRITFSTVAAQIFLALQSRLSRHVVVRHIQVDSGVEVAKKLPKLLRGGE